MAHSLCAPLLDIHFEPTATLLLPPDLTADYNLARQTVPHLVATETDPLIFYRCEKAICGPQPNVWSCIGRCGDKSLVKNDGYVPWTCRGRKP